MKIALAASLFLVLLLSIGFGRRQRAGAIGGRMSRAKQLWLGWAVYVWFFLCPLVAFFERDLILAVFSGFMWLRGIVELVMMYGTKSWRPVYGISHDVLCILLIGGLCLVFPPGRQAPLIACVLVSLVLETGYALAFRGTAATTTGDDAVWFADADDPKFRRINRVTAAANVPLFLFLAGWLLLAFLK